MSVVRMSDITTVTRNYEREGLMSSEKEVLRISFLVEGVDLVSVRDVDLTPKRMDIKYSMRRGSPPSYRIWEVRLEGPCPPGSWQKVAVVRLFSYSKDVPSWIREAVDANLPDTWKDYEN